MSRRKPNDNLDDIWSAQTDQFTDISSVDDVMQFESRIIFSGKAMGHLIKLANQTMFLNDHPERGCFFLGSELGYNTNQIYISEFTTDFLEGNGYFQGGGLDCNNVTQPCGKYQRGELLERISNGSYDCCIHFHTHPPKGFFDVFSDRDYMCFELLAKSLKRICNVNFFAMLATPNGNARSNRNIDNVQLSALFCEPLMNGQFEYYRFPNICYIDDGIVYELGRYERTVAPRLSTGRQVPTRVSIQAIGQDPNNGKRIENRRIGIWRDGQLYLDDERRTQGAITPSTIANATIGQPQRTIDNAGGVFSRDRNPYRRGM